jgi:fumarylacetoacetase
MSWQGIKFLLHLKMYSEHFSFENIPYGIASSSSHPQKSVATRLGDQVIFLDQLVKFGLLLSLPESTTKTFYKVRQY